MRAPPDPPARVRPPTSPSRTEDARIRSEGASEKRRGPGESRGLSPVPAFGTTKRVALVLRKRLIEYVFDSFTTPIRKSQPLGGWPAATDVGRLRVRPG